MAEDRRERDEIKTGDEVRHAPTGETWTVAYVEGDRLAWCGWPPGEARLADCTLLRSCSEDESRELLVRLAEIREDDKRGIYARNMLEAHRG